MRIFVVVRTYIRTYKQATSPCMLASNEITAFMLTHTVAYCFPLLFLSAPLLSVSVKSTRYVPALRELRQFAMLLVFTATDQSRLVQRLQEVYRVESMRASLSALTALCDKAENDIRSCLNTLQVTQAYKHGCYLLAGYCTIFCSYID